MMTSPTTDAVRRSIEVLVPVPRAWAVFTEEMGRWWPLSTHSIGADTDSPPDTVVVEPHLGGSIYEAVGTDRRSWGVIVEWDPPHRLAVDWTVGNDVATRWAATFSPTERGTRVDLVHTGFEAHGLRGDEMRKNYGADEGWVAVLSDFAEVANATAA
jgi:uncharacterized protein YndB with AHSA1/START domain